MARGPPITGLDTKGAQETKTRTALEYFAKTLKEVDS